MFNEEFKVGDKVIRNYTTPNGRYIIGTVVKITDKRKDVVVDYGNFKETYNSTGTQKGGGSIWSTSFIQLLTPEIEESIRKSRLISQCKKEFEAKKDLTLEQAEKILEILREE